MAAKINLRVTSDFAQASADLKEFGALTEKERQRVEKFQEAFDKGGIENFTRRNQRAAAAVTATSGKLQGMQREYKGLQREIQRLIRGGLDPQADSLKPLITRYQQLEKEIQSASGAADKGARRFGALDGVMVGIGATLTNMAQNALRRVVDFTLESAQAASDAEETFAKYLTVFRDVRGNAVTAMEELADSFDLADSTAAKLIGNTGDLLTGFGLAQDAALEMSEATTRLAIDLASFTNASGGAEAVSRALTSAYANEREALKTYGIVINESMVQARMLKNEQEGLTFETEQQAKIFATLQLAQEQSQNAIGDYARTSESAANVQRQLNEQTIRFRETLGEGVQKGLTPFRRELSRLLSEINDARDELDNWNEAQRGGSTDTIDYEAAIALQKESVAALNSQYREAARRVGENSSQLDSLVETLDRANTRLRTLEQNQANAIRREQEMARIQRERAENQAELEEAAERAAEIERIAGERRRAIREEYTDKIAEMELSSLELIERARQDALDQAAQDIVVSGAEIDQINRFYDLRREQELENQEQKRQEILDQRMANHEQWLAEYDEKIREQNEKEVEAEREKQQKIADLRKQAQEQFLDSVMSLDEALTQLTNARVAKEIAAVDRETQRKLENLELVEETKIESLKRQLAEAIDKEDKETADTLRNQIKREEILADAEKKKAELEYKAAMATWRLQKVGAIADMAAAAIRTYAQLGFMPWAHAAVAAGLAASGIRLAAIQESKPQPPTAQTGTGPLGITIPETNSGRADNVAVMASPGETVNVSPRGASGMGVMNIHVELERQVLINVMNRAIESGEIRITTRNIQGGVAA